MIYVLAIMSSAIYFNYFYYLYRLWDKFKFSKYKSEWLGVFWESITMIEWELKYGRSV